jgi:nodulation protein E
MRDEPVVVTGIGAVTAAEESSDALWESARDGRSGVGEFDFPESSQRVKIAAAMSPKDYAGDLPRQWLAVSDREARFALVAAAQAVAQAGPTDTALGARAAVIMGCGIGGSTNCESGFHDFLSGESRLNPFTIPMVMRSAAGSLISARHKASGFCTTISTDCFGPDRSILSWRAEPRPN